MNETHATSGRPNRQLLLFGGVCLFAILAKLYLSAVSSSSLASAAHSGLENFLIAAAFGCVAAAVAGIASVVGKRLNRVACVLLGAAGGGLASAIYQPMLGALIGLVVGGLVAAGAGRAVGIGAARALTVLFVGAVGGTIALGTYDSPREVPVVAALILSATIALAMAIMFLPFVLPRRSRSVTSRQLIGRSLLFLPLFVGLWFGISLDTARRVRALAERSNFAMTRPSIKWLWLGLFDMNGLSVRPDVPEADLVKLQRFTELQFLALQGSSVTDRTLERLRGMTTLQSLSLRDTSVTDAGLAHLAGMTSLRSLTLTGTQVTGTGLKHIRTGLMSLQLDGTAVTDEGLVHLKNLPWVVYLGLRDTRITDDGLVHLRRFNRLRSLDLSGTRVTDSGLATLSELKGLWHLHLAGTAVTDAGLSNLSPLAALSFLDLEDTAISDEGLSHLKLLTSLGWLKLEGTNVTAAGVEELSRARPKLVADPPTRRAAQ